ncbi:hypothetical protein GF377_01985 [candidate division GN15 bacterium]|nr:hypothetical protein [candidate division GN15 bacterium]
MDVPHEQLIDIGLNVLGYLVAATLGMVVYSFFGRRRPVTDREAAAVQVAAAAAPEASEGNRKMNFVDFRRSDSSEPNGDLAGAVSRTSSHGARRDRAEIIRLAREMIAARTPQETIKRTLPISDGELALLQGGEER